MVVCAHTTRSSRLATWAPRALAALAVVALFGTGAPLRAQEPDIKLGEGDAEKGATEATRKLTPEEEYVRENLQEFLSPSTLEFDDKGVATMTFVFSRKIEAHKGIFSLKFGRTPRDPLRFTFPGEEGWEGSAPGVRISDGGLALLNAWFVDDVEGEIALLQHVNFKRSHIAGVVFATDKGKIIGSNYGSQCAMFSRRGAIKPADGTPQPVVFNEHASIKLAVRGGVYEAHRQGRKKAEAKYREKDFASGRIGFVWGGSNSCTITTLKVQGKLDYKVMAEKIKEGLEGDAD